MRLDAGAADLGIDHQLVEVLHEHRLGDDRQLMEGARLETTVQTSVERGAADSMVAQVAQRAGLEHLELAPRPPLVAAQARALAQDLRQPDGLHASASGLSATSIRMPSGSPGCLIYDRPV